MKYNPYYDQEQFQQHKYEDQPTLRLLDWGLRHLQKRSLPSPPEARRAALRQLLLAQIEVDLADLSLAMTTRQIDTNGDLERVELSLSIGGLVESRATLLVPAQHRLHTPLFLCLHGHQHEGREWTIGEGPAAALTSAGYACLCPDLLGLGENRGRTDDVIRGNITYDLLVHNALMLGWSLNGLRLWLLEQWMNAVREVGYLGKPVSHFACAGFSLGGELVLFLSALHNEISPIYISGYACPWEASYWSKLHCRCAYVPGLMRFADLLDIFALLAPRPLAIEAGHQDRSFPWKDTEMLLKRISAHYKDLSAGHCFHQIATDSEHLYQCDPRTLAFLKRITDENQ